MSEESQNRRMNTFGNTTIRQINLGTERNPKCVKLNGALEPNYAKEAKDLLREFKDVFVWSYQYLEGILTHIAEHII